MSLSHPQWDDPTSAVEALTQIEARVQVALDGDRLEDAELTRRALYTALEDVWKLADKGLYAQALLDKAGDD
jgi:hypothetical protein